MILKIFISLKIAIRFLEEEVDDQKALLTENISGIIDSLRPSSIIKDLVSDVISSDELKNNILNTTIGISTGYVARKLFFGKAKNLFAIVSGYLMEFGVAYLISHPPGYLKGLFSELTEHNTGRDEKKDPVTV